MTALEMDPAIRARWVAALRSGEYEQGRHQLRTDHGGLCCLGVLCELAVADGVIPAAEYSFGEWVYDENDTELPAPVREWAGLMTCNPWAPVDADGNGATLAELNDGCDAGLHGPDEREPWTFAQIADLIEGVAPQPGEPS